MALLHHGYTPLGQYVPEVLSPTSAEKTLHGHCYATRRIAVTQLAALNPPPPAAKQDLQRQSPAECLFSAMVTPFVTSCVYCIAATIPPQPTCFSGRVQLLLQQVLAPAAVHSVPAFAKSPPQQHTLQQQHLLHIFNVLSLDQCRAL